jgi:exopolysaccharide/PEP-CTERM locus tyrosine autokinase
MSLFEQAIARLRNQASGNKDPSFADKQPRRPGSSDDQLSALAAVPIEPAKRITIDADALRERGYLPEAGTARQFADHYRRIKRPLIDKALSGAVAAGEPRVMMITSALPGDGKTFNSVNLAVSMALERDISVLLVDCDVVKGHISDIFGLRDDAGLVDALVDESLDIETLVVGTNQRGLSILPAGARSDGTTELLNSNRMRQVIASLCSRVPRRLVVLDSPPLLITNEGRALTKLAGQIVLVVRAGHTPRQAVTDAIALFEPQQVGGIILNEVKVTRSEGYGYYGYGSYGTDGDAS